MKNRLFHGASFLLAAWLLSCSTEFEPLIEAPSIPVVYSIFNCYDSIQWVRLSKTFLMRGEVETTRIPKDSLYYPDARVTLERWHDDYLLAQSVLTREDRMRDSGLFPREPNPVYFLKKSLSSQMLFSSPVAGDRVRLIIEIPDQLVIYSQVIPVTIPLVENPRRDGSNVELYDPDQPFFVTWTSLEYYQEMYLEIHYKDHYEDRSILRTAIWREYHSLPPPDPRQPITSVLITGTQMMQRIAANIREDSAVIVRTLDRMVILLHFTDNQVYTYNLIYPVARGDMAGATYSNIVNGYGLFGSVAKNERWFTFSYRSADSLANGQYTKHLRFKNW